MVIPVNLWEFVRIWRVWLVIPVGIPLGNPVSVSLHVRDRFIRGDLRHFGARLDDDEGI